MAEQTERQSAAAALKRSLVRRWQVLDLQEVHHQQAGLEWAPHWHDEWSVGVVLAGTCHCQVGGQPWQLPAGTVMRIAPGTVHTGALLPDAQSPAVQVLMWYLPAAWLQQHQLHWPEQSQFALLPALATAGSAIDNLPQLISWLQQLDRHFAAVPVQQAPMLTAHARQILTQVRQLVSAGDCTVQSAAAACGISREMLHRHVRRWTGMSPQQYFRTIRINRARTLLLEGCSIADTAEQCGFADQAHFSRWFRRSFGFSPGDLIRPALAAE